MDTLSRLFGSETRVKAMRLFLFNPDGSFGAEALVERLQIKKREASKEMDYLRKLGLIKRKKGTSLYSLDKAFAYADALSDFLIRTNSLERETILKKIQKTGRIKAVLISGIFTKDLESRLDLFVIGDAIKTNSLERVVRSLESDMGKEIRYAALSAPDFAYRLSMNDKLVRDVLDFPFEALVDKLGVSKS